MRPTDNKPLARSIGLHALAAVVTLKNQLLQKPNNDNEELGQFLPQVAVDVIVGHDSMTKAEIMQGNFKSGARPLHVI
eukprot:SAG31_NODE_14555_length_799_cov_1.311429_1_plen_77_part_10